MIASFATMRLEALPVARVSQSGTSTASAMAKREREREGVCGTESVTYSLAEWRKIHSKKVPFDSSLLIHKVLCACTLVGSIEIYHNIISRIL